jgi:NAD-dependent dihydropyrimidine dehydrogenase PreA subunit
MATGTAKRMNYVRIEADQCKGCRLCVETCPNHCIVIGSKINRLGYQHARFERPECTACGLCFYVCPEPGAITVYRDATDQEMAS